jgi:hypothetical protein
MFRLSTILGQPLVSMPPLLGVPQKRHARELHIGHRNGGPNNPNDYPGLGTAGVYNYNGPQLDTGAYN